MGNAIDQQYYYNDWNKFTDSASRQSTIKSITIDAQKHREELGIEPNSLKYIFLKAAELENKHLEYTDLINVVRLFLDQLSLSLTGIPHIIALSDRNGWIIDELGMPMGSGLEISELCIGASWTEENIGCNGIGTSLTTGKPVVVQGVEHTNQIFGLCTSIGAPLRYKGNIVGAIDICVPSTYSYPYSHPIRLNHLISCINSIEYLISNLHEGLDKSSSKSKVPSTNELIATAVHDIKNPLAVIRGLGELGRLSSDTSEGHGYFNRIIKQVDELNDMVIDLLSIFKPEELIMDSPVSIILEVLQEMEPICSLKGIKLSFFNRGSANTLLCQRLFKRSIDNLITNAIQALDNGGEIEIQTQVIDDSMLITIRDTAGGIPEEIRENIFDAFSFRRKEGTGLGLFMVYHAITNAHKGQVWFDTQINEGTKFFIKLPISQGN